MMLFCSLSSVELRKVRLGKGRVSYVILDLFFGLPVCDSVLSFDFI